MIQLRQRAATFRELHHGPTFVIPNPWDRGSARLLEEIGFPALATTSSGFAFTLGRRDGAVTFEEKLEHCRALSDAVEIPVSADLENLFADDPEDVAKNLLRAAETGIAGGSIEDWSGDAIYDFGHAVERVAAAVAAARSLPFPFVLTARAENLIRGRDDLDDTLRRLEAYQEAGADVLYPPGLRDLEQMRRVTAALDRPVNVLGGFVRVAGPSPRPATVEELAAGGAQRISVGGSLAFAAVGALFRSARSLREEGSFDWLSGVVRGRDLGGTLRPE